MVFIEGLAVCFWMLLICVIGIANGPVGLVVFYEPDVQERVVQLGLTTKEKIKKTSVISGLALFIPMLIGVPAMVYGLSGADSFMSGFWQMYAIYMIAGLFDRLFIDVYWVEHTKAWSIPGTENLRPYIPLKTAVKKWVGTIVGFLIYSAGIAWLAARIIPH